MKTLFTIIAMCLFIAINSNALDIKKYKVKSGIIEYRIEGVTTGTETVYFDDWGIKEAKYTTTITKLFGIKQETNTITITDKDWSYNIDLKEKTGTKSSNKQIKELIDGMTQKDYERFGEKMLENMNAKQVGNESILGFNCEVWDIQKMSSKTWNYQYVPLKIEINLLGKTVYTATKFEPNTKVPVDKFKVPNGITITEQEMPDLQKIFEQNYEEQEEDTEE